MAKGFQLITGGIGPVVLCHIRATNKIVLRSRPSPYKQTAGTIAAQSTFGMASVAGKVLRRDLSSVLPFPKNRMMQVNFTGAINKWLKTNPPAGVQPVDERIGLSNFAFNKACPFESRWKVGMEILKSSRGDLAIRIPGFVPTEKISAPAGTVSVECRIAVAACVLKKGTAAGQFKTTFTFPYNNQEIASREINTGITGKRGNLIVCGAYLIFHMSGRNNKTITDNVKFMPAGVVGVVWG